ncbi:MAG: hypothetical protein NZO58_08745 [Gemmataceae bacterium]|nr:hypothetical protein [Gemmataceae bacterium]
MTAGRLGTVMRGGELEAANRGALLDGTITRGGALDGAMPEIRGGL